MPVSTEKWIEKTKKYLLDVTNKLVKHPESIKTYYDSASTALMVVDAVVKAEKWATMLRDRMF